MLTSKHFENCQIPTFFDYDAPVFEQSSVDAIEHLDTASIDEVISIDIYGLRRPRIKIKYYHIEKITPKSIQLPQHHSGSFADIRTGYKDWEMICKHEITVYYPEICLIRKLHQLGNGVVRKAMLDFIKSNRYWDIKSMPYNDATWLMANLLGANEDK